MNYRNENLRDLLAAEYVVGTLHGRARRRFEGLLRADADLRRIVTKWEERLGTIADAIEPVTPPRRVWRNVEARLAPARAPAAGFWRNLNLWRALGLISTGLAFGLLLYLGIATRGGEVSPQYAAVLSDKQGRPVMLVNANQGARDLTVMALAGQPIPTDRSFQLWGLPQAGNPQSLGVISDTGKTYLLLEEQRAAALASYPNLAVSLEPRGGSPTGLPTGPVLYTGPLLRL